MELQISYSICAKVKWILYNRDMKISKKEFNKIKYLMPIERKQPKIPNRQFLNGLLYIIQNGCKWRALPKKFGNWHTIYMRFSRWSKNGTIQRIFEELKKQNIINTPSNVLRIDSISIKVHPDATGAKRINLDQSIGRSKGG